MSRVYFFFFSCLCSWIFVRLLVWFLIWAIICSHHHSFISDSVFFFIKILFCLQNQIGYFRNSQKVKLSCVFVETGENKLNRLKFSGNLSSATNKWAKRQKEKLHGRSDKEEKKWWGKWVCTTVVSISPRWRRSISPRWRLLRSTILYHLGEINTNRKIIRCGNHFVFLSSVSRRM